jgi:glycosyltransferase involved in cell wall biosynthesis
MTPQKAPEVWLEAAARIAEARPDARFVWVWSGEMEAGVRNRACALGLERRLQFLGYRADARDLIGAFDVYLLASAFEGLPYTVIEALAAGVPVAATNVVGTRDVVRHGGTGLLAPPGDAAALAANALWLLGHPSEARRMGAAGAADVRNRFSVARMVQQTAALYASVLAEEEGTPPGGRPGR